MKLIYRLGLVLTAALMAGCGGGGGSPGTVAGSATTTAATTTTGGATVSTVTGDVEVTVDGSVSMELLSGAGVATQSISAVEIAQVKATVKDSKGVAVAGAIVSFAEAGVGLLSFSPLSMTAMTNSAGVAVVEVRATSLTNVGATAISAAVTVSKATITASKNLEITNAPTVGGVAADPQALASAVNFVSSDPSDSAIVLMGAGGNGRTETGILKFRVVDKNGTPVKSAIVNFVVNPAADVTLNIAQGKSDGDGIVLTSVSSKTVATAVVVTASVQGRTISAQSDQLKVTTGVGIAAGFEILPQLYNLDGALSGDSTSVTARLVDANSNPVADGVPVVMVASGGKIGTSSAGGCNTVDGACSVTFAVQNPRPATGLVTITGSARVGDTTTLSQLLTVHMSSAAIGFYEPAFGVVPVSPLNSLAPVVLTGCAKFSKSVMISNALGYSPPAGTVVGVIKDSATGIGASIPSGNTVLDVSNFGPSGFSLVIDPTAADNPPCDDEGISTVTGVLELSADAPKSKRNSKFSLPVTFPTGALKLVQINTADENVAISMNSCKFETFQIDVIGSAGLTLPAGSTFTVGTSPLRINEAFVTTVAPPASVTAIPPVDSPAFVVLDRDLKAPSSSSSIVRQSIWLRVVAPSGGSQPCVAGATKPGTATFVVNVNITAPNGKRNTQNVTVSYPISLP